MCKWVLIFALTLTASHASARFEDWGFVEAIQDSKYTVVGKVVKIEMFSSVINSKSYPCGFKVYVEVVEDLKGNAPKFLNVGIAVPLSPNHTHLMIIEEGQAYFHTDTLFVYTIQDHIDAVERCKSNLPQYSLNHLIMGEIVAKRELKEEKWVVGTRWLKKPTYLEIPAHVDAVAYRPVNIDVTKGTAQKVENNYFGEYTGNAGVVKAEELSSYDFLPSSDMLFGATFYNWEHLKLVWVDHQAKKHE